MTGNRTTLALALAAAVAALALGGCGGDDNESGAYGGKGGGATTESSGGGGGEKAAAAGDSSGAVVSLASVPELGLVLADSKGFVLYDFHKDQGTKSACYGGCAKVWPPLLTEGEPQAGNGASAAKLGTSKRKDGTVQVTYAGHPLYTYVTDEQPGEANGHDIDSFGAEWYALQGSGAEAED